MFDVTSGTCSECFRTVVLNPGRNSGTSTEDLPQLIEVDVDARVHIRNTVKLTSQNYTQMHGPPVSSINCMVGSIGANANSYMVTGGSDATIRFWDFWRPANCYVICRPRASVQPKHNMERIDFDSKRRLMLCREMASNNMHESSRMLNHRNSMDPSKFDHSHTDSILDLKIIDNSTLVSCSRDCTVKVWR
jgi:WD40 repeat protein